MWGSLLSSAREGNYGIIVWGGWGVKCGRENLASTETRAAAGERRLIFGERLPNAAKLWYSLI